MTDADTLNPRSSSITDLDAPSFTQIVPAKNVPGAWELRVSDPGHRTEFYIGTFPRKADATATAKGWRRQWHTRRALQAPHRHSNTRCAYRTDEAWRQSCWAWSLHS